MNRYVLVAATALSLSAGSAFAAGPQPIAAPNAYYGYYSSGYVFPNDGSPSADQPMARAVPQQQGPGPFSRLYLYSPSEGTDGTAG